MCFIYAIISIITYINKSWENMFGFYDQDAADREYEFNARYDYLNEAYGSTAIDSGREMDMDDFYLQQQQEAFQWLLRQGGRATIDRASAVFAPDTFKLLSEEGFVKQVEGVWEVSEVSPVCPVKVSAASLLVYTDDDIAF